MQTKGTHHVLNALSRFAGPKSYHASLKCDFDNNKIKKIVYNITMPSHGVCAIPNKFALTLAHSTKQLHKMPLPDKPPKKVKLKSSLRRKSWISQTHEACSKMYSSLDPTLVGAQMCSRGTCSNSQYYFVTQKRDGEVMLCFSSQFGFYFCCSAFFH